MSHKFSCSCAETMPNPISWFLKSSVISSLLSMFQPAFLDSFHWHNGSLSIATIELHSATVKRFPKDSLTVRGFFFVVRCPLLQQRRSITFLDLVPKDIG